MLTAREVLSPFNWKNHAAADSITLDHDARHRRRITLTSDNGTFFLLDLPRATVLLEGDALQLSDGSLIRVNAAPESLMYVTAGAQTSLLRLAWHIGNRHLPAMLGDTFILLREDHVIKAMLEGLGAAVEAIHAPFTPEQGAYSGGGHSHGKHSHHDHGDDQEHSHDQKHSHPHSHGHHHH